MRLSTPRIHPVKEEQLTPDQRVVLQKNKMRGSIQNIFLTLAQHMNLAKRWLVFANHILNKSTLDPIDREIIILRIGWLCQSGYEWAQHELIASALGLSFEKIEAIKIGEQAVCWNKKERLLIIATNELYSDAFISTPSWDELKSYYTDPQMMDLVFTVGQYNLVSMALNSFGVQLDDDLPRWKGKNDEYNR